MLFFGMVAIGIHPHDWITKHEPHWFPNTFFLALSRDALLLGMLPFQRTVKGSALNMHGRHGFHFPPCAFHSCSR